MPVVLTWPLLDSEICPPLTSIGRARAEERIAIKVFRGGLLAKACQPQEHTFSLWSFFLQRISQTAAKEEEE